MHAESGFLRLKADGSVESVIAQITGIAEVSAGRAEPRRIQLRSTEIANATQACHHRCHHLAADARWAQRLSGVVPAGPRSGAYLRAVGRRCALRAGADSPPGAVFHTSSTTRHTSAMVALRAQQACVVTCGEPRALQVSMATKGQLEATQHLAATLRRVTTTAGP